MQKQSTLLKTELSELEQQREYVSRQLAEAETKLHGARGGLSATSEPKDLDALTSAHSKTSSLRDALATLEAQIEKKQIELGQAETDEREADRLAKVQRLERQRDSARAKYLSARQQTQDALLAHLAEMNTAVQEWRRLKSEISELSGAGERFELPVPSLMFGLEIDGALRRYQNDAERQAKKELARANEKTIMDLEDLSPAA